MRVAVATLGLALLLAGPLVPGAWVWIQRLNGGVCGASGTFSVSVEWVPPRAICTYVRHSRVFEVRHDAPYKDVAGALMAMGLVLAISAFAAPPPPGQNRAMGG